MTEEHSSLRPIHPPFRFHEAAKMRTDAVSIVRHLAPMLEPIRQRDAVLARLHGEVMWLRQELEKGTIELPFSSTQDLYFPYALSEGLLDEWPEIRERIESLYDAVYE
jgi:hypothetical protein